MSEAEAFRDKMLARKSFVYGETTLTFTHDPRTGKYRYSNFDFNGGCQGAQSWTYSGTFEVLLVKGKPIVKLSQTHYHYMCTEFSDDDEDYSDKPKISFVTINLDAPEGKCPLSDALSPEQAAAQEAAEREKDQREKLFTKMLSNKRDFTFVEPKPYRAGSRIRIDQAGEHATCIHRANFASEKITEEVYGQPRDGCEPVVIRYGTVEVVQPTAATASAAAEAFEASCAQVAAITGDENAKQKQQDRNKISKNRAKAAAGKRMYIVVSWTHEQREHMEVGCVPDFVDGSSKNITVYPTPVKRYFYVAGDRLISIDEQEAALAMAERIEAQEKEGAAAAAKFE